MKVYVNKAEGRATELVRNILIRDLELKGIEVTPYIAEADTVFRYDLYPVKCSTQLLTFFL